MVYKLTIEDFRQIVDVAACRRNCRGHEVRGGRAEDGHSSCSSCPGNYYAGGECNYGGRHVLAQELDQINKNFEGFEILVSRYAKLKKVKNETDFNKEKQELVQAFTTMKQRCENPSSFLYASCMGVSDQRAKFQANVQSRFQRFAQEVGKFVDAVQKCTYQQFADFKAKLEKIQNLKAEAAKIAEQIKKEKDPAKKAKLIAMLNQVNNDIKGIAQDLERHPARGLFDDDINKGLDNLLKDILCPGPDSKNNPFLGGRGGVNGRRGNKWGSKGDNAQNEQQEGQGIFSPQTKETLKSIGVAALSLLIL